MIHVINPDEQWSFVPRSGQLYNIYWKHKVHKALVKRIKLYLTRRSIASNKTISMESHKSNVRFCPKTGSTSNIASQLGLPAFTAFRDQSSWIAWQDKNCHFSQPLAARMSKKGREGPCLVNFQTREDNQLK